MSKAKPKRLTIDSLYDQLFAGIPVIDEGVIGDYYHQSFREDVRRFVGPELPTVFGTQSFGEGGGLDRVPNERWATFLVCLYFTVLVDQAMHAHFPDLHDKFQELTGYPRFVRGLRGDNLNPRVILDAPVDSGRISSRRMAEVIPGGMNLFVSEVVDFSRLHMPQLQPREFFGKLLKDPQVWISFLIMDSPEFAESPVCRAFVALRQTLDKRIPGTWPD